MMIAVLRFVEHPTPLILAQVVAMRMSSVLIDTTQIRGRAVVQATKVFVLVSAVPKERIVVVTRVAHQITSVETADSVVSIRVIYFLLRVRLHLHRRNKRAVVIYLKELRPAEVNVVTVACNPVGLTKMGSQNVKSRASVNGKSPSLSPHCDR
jgi:hypothetical protein